MSYLRKCGICEIVAILERFWLHYAQCSGGSPRAEELGWSFWRMSMGILFTGQKTILLQGSPCLWSYRVAQKGQNKNKLRVFFFSNQIPKHQYLANHMKNKFGPILTRFADLVSDLGTKGSMFKWRIIGGLFSHPISKNQSGLRQFGQVATNLKQFEKF